MVFDLFFFAYSVLLAPCIITSFIVLFRKPLNDQTSSCYVQKQSYSEKTIERETGERETIERLNLRNVPKISKKSKHPIKNKEK